MYMRESKERVSHIFMLISSMAQQALRFSFRDIWISHSALPCISGDEIFGDPPMLKTAITLSQKAISISEHNRRYLVREVWGGYE